MHGIEENCSQQVISDIKSVTLHQNTTGIYGITVAQSKLNITRGLSNVGTNLTIYTADP